MLERNPRPLTSLPRPAAPPSAALQSPYPSCLSFVSIVASPLHLSAVSFRPNSLFRHGLCIAVPLMPPSLPHARVSLYPWPWSLSVSFVFPCSLLARFLYHWFPFQVGAHSKKEARGFLSAPIKASPRCPILIRALICGEILRPPFFRRHRYFSALPGFHVVVPFARRWPPPPTATASLTSVVDKINRRYPSPV